VWTCCYYVRSVRYDSAITLQLRAASRIIYSGLHWPHHRFSFYALRLFRSVTCKKQRYICSNITAYRRIHLSINAIESLCGRIILSNYVCAWLFVKIGQLQQKVSSMIGLHCVGQFLNWNFLFSKWCTFLRCSMKIAETWWKRNRILWSGDEHSRLSASGNSSSKALQARLMDGLNSGTVSLFSPCIHKCIHTKLYFTSKLVA